MNREQIFDFLDVPQDFREKSVVEFGFLYASDGVHGAIDGFLHLDRGMKIDGSDDVINKMFGLVGLFISAHAKLRENLIKSLPIVLFLLVCYKKEVQNRFGKSSDEILAALAMAYILDLDDLEEGKEQLVKFAEVAKLMENSMPQA